MARTGATKIVKAKKTYVCDGPCGRRHKMPACFHFELTEELRKFDDLEKTSYDFCVACVLAAFLGKSL